MLRGGGVEEQGDARKQMVDVYVIILYVERKCIEFFYEDDWTMESFRLTYQFSNKWHYVRVIIIY